MKKNLEVSMLGTFRMQYGNHSFIIDRKSTTKTNRLLQIILHAGTEGVTREELVGRLWENRIRGSSQAVPWRIFAGTGSIRMGNFLGNEIPEIIYVLCKETVRNLPG